MKILSINRNHEGQDRTGRSRMIAGVVVNGILIISILFYAAGILSDDRDTGATALSTTPRTIKDPAEYMGVIVLDSLENATQEINDKLTDMAGYLLLYGLIHPIDDSSPHHRGVLFLDHEIGGVLYWEVWDDLTDVRIDAMTSEIIFYSHYGYQSGQFTLQDAEERSENIITGFTGEQEVPEDAEEPWTRLVTPISMGLYDVDTGQTSYTNHTYWNVDYNRTHTIGQESVQTEDYIRVRFDTAGNCVLYRKIWFMDLNAPIPPIVRSQQDAEGLATGYVGENSTIEFTGQKMVRPNRFWPLEGEYFEDEDDEPTLQYGGPPTLVYEIWVNDGEDNLLIFHMSAVCLGETIVGGDYAQGYFENDQQQQE